MRKSSSRTPRVLRPFHYLDLRKEERYPFPQARLRDPPCHRSPVARLDYYPNIGRFRFQATRSCAARLQLSLRLSHRLLALLTPSPHTASLHALLHRSSFTSLPSSHSSSPFTSESPQILSAAVVAVGSVLDVVGSVELEMPLVKSLELTVSIVFVVVSESVVVGLRSPLVLFASLPVPSSPLPGQAGSSSRSAASERDDVRIIGGSERGACSRRRQAYSKSAGHGQGLGGGGQKAGAEKSSDFDRPLPPARSSPRVRRSWIHA